MPYKYQVVVGNVIGVIEQPEFIDPERPAMEQYIVKIGAVDSDLPLDKSDSKEVIARLQGVIPSHFIND